MESLIEIFIALNQCCNKSMDRIYLRNNEILFDINLYDIIKIFTS